MYPRRQILLGITSVGLLTLLPSCKERDEIILQREWTANAEFAGDVWASEIANKQGTKLEVREGSELLDPIKIVRSGQAHFGVASSDRILRENETGADLAVIAAATYRSPVVFLTHQELKIEQPKDFIGRTVGLQPGTNTELIFSALAKKEGIPLEKVNIVDPGWGTQTFETGTVDVLGAFEYDEPISLEMKNYPIGTSVIPEKYGVRYVGTVFFTRKALILEKPETVQKFMNFLVEGWNKALSDPTAAIDLLAKYFKSVRDNIDKERRSFSAGREYFRGENGYLLYASKERWDEMARSLQELGKLSTYDFNKNIDYRYLDKASSK